jgi:hypothetical protein
MVSSPKGLGPEEDCGGNPLVREGAPQNKTVTVKTVINNIKIY